MAMSPEFILGDIPDEIADLQERVKELERVLKMLAKLLEDKT